MRIDLSDNYAAVDISAHVDFTLFIPNKPMNHHPKFGRRFVGHPAEMKLL
jgi:hypothetical protein